MDETSKVVQELRTELYKRKFAHVAIASSEDISCKHNQWMLSSSETGDIGPKDIKVSGAPMIDDVECPSSVLIEEQDPQVLEMDQLEPDPRFFVRLEFTLRFSEIFARSLTNILFIFAFFITSFFWLLGI